MVVGYQLSVAGLPGRLWSLLTALLDPFLSGVPLLKRLSGGVEVEKPFHVVGKAHQEPSIMPIFDCHVHIFPDRIAS